ESTLRRFMRERPAKVDLDIDDVPVSDRENLRVPKSTAICGPAFIGHEHAIAIRHEMDEVEPLGHLAVGPATAEVRFTVEAIVEGARELKVFGDDLLDRGPVLRRVRFIGGASDRDVPGCDVLT